MADKVQIRGKENLLSLGVYPETTLAHGSDEALGGAYDRSKYFDARIGMMQAWADYLDKLRIGAGLITD